VFFFKTFFLYKKLNKTAKQTKTNQKQQTNKMSLGKMLNTLSFVGRMCPFKKNNEFFLLEKILYKNVNRWMLFICIFFFAKFVFYQMGDFEIRLVFKKCLQ
jgi:hypothetical protein